MEGSSLPPVIERLFAAINRRDTDGIVACLAPGYAGEQPLHPERLTHDRAQLRRNWQTVFRGTPGFELWPLRTAMVDSTVWVEVTGLGQRARDGATVEISGVMIMGLDGDLIAWDRLYLEPHLLAETIEALPRD